MTGIHETAIVSDGAEIGADVNIGPYCVIGGNVKIGNGSSLHSHVVVDGNTTVGSNCRIFPFASIGTQTQDLKFKGDDTYVEIGDDTTIREYVTVNSGTNAGETTRIGSGCLLMAYSHVAHACSVGNEVIMANCATLAGDVVLEDQVILGGLSAVHQFVNVGRLCIVGGCTKITQDCPPFMIVDGNPSSVRGINRVGLERREVPEESRKMLKEAYRILYRKNLSTSKAVDEIGKSLADCPEIEHLLRFIMDSKRGIVK